jgi:uncharacterized membrane protein YdjX (TVP38/TMEM64 family)
VQHRVRAILLIAVVAGLFWAGTHARSELGLEFSQESVARVVAGLGVWAWGLYLGIVVFRTFLGLPSAVVLSAGGLVFGTGTGALLGGIGIAISAVLWYAAARGAGRPWFEQRLGPRARELQRRAEAAGPLLVGISTAHPVGPLTPFHLGSGLAAIPIVPFLVAVSLGSPVRSSTLAFFGSSLLEFGTPRFYASSALVLVLGLLPLAHRGLRERIFGAFRPFRETGETGAP